MFTMWTYELAVVGFLLVIFSSGSVPFDKSTLTFSSKNTMTPVDIIVDLRPTINIAPQDRICVSLPRFTRYFDETTAPRFNLSYTDLSISPSYFFEARFIEGVNFYDMEGNQTTPYSAALLEIKTRVNTTIPAFTPIVIKIYNENGIGAACGFPSSPVYAGNPGYFEPFRVFKLFMLNESTVSSQESVLVNGVLTTQTVYQNITLRNGDAMEFDSYDGMGSGCASLNSCNGHGRCDYCYEACKCFEGYGAPSDLIVTGGSTALDCSQRVCPKGKAIGDLPSAANKAHALAECSNQGICDRSNGTCTCFPPFHGAACEKMMCPNDCSGHGKCQSISEIAKFGMYDSVYRQSKSLAYETGAAFETTAWDRDTIFGCTCDSSWPVGFGKGETQLSQYFGPDCSLKRCPSGDDPYTSNDETSCFGVSQVPNSAGEVGKLGNKCHVDCSNRGICDYKTGTCKCFEGMWGEACNKIAGAGRSSRILERADGNYENVVVIDIEGN